MKIELNIPDEQKDRVLNTYCKFFVYDKFKLKEETKPQFVKRQMTEQIKNIVRHQEAEDVKHEFEYFEIT